MAQPQSQAPSPEPTPQHRRRAQRAGITVLLLALGVAQALAMAWPFADAFQGQASGLLQLISLTGFAYLLHTSTNAQQAFWSGWRFASGWLVASTWWLYISMHDYGGMPASLAAVAVCLLGAGLALLYAVACWVYHWVCQPASVDKTLDDHHPTRRATAAKVVTRATHVSITTRAFAFAAVWLLAEISRGTLWTGFPWAAAGYAHVDSPMRAWAPWVGVYGLSAISAWMAMLAAAGCQHLVRRYANTKSDSRNTKTSTSTSSWLSVLCVCLLALTWVTSPVRHAGTDIDANTSGIRVTLLQGNVPQDLKFGPGVPMALSDYRQALMDNTSDLIVTPETALPLLLDYLPDGYWQRLQQRYATGDQAALIGLPLRATAPALPPSATNTTGSGNNSNTSTSTPLQASNPQYTNSALALLPGEPAPGYRYDKHHLVPFGEFVPPMFRWFVQLMHIPLGDFSRGAVAQPSLLWHGERIAPNICFEDLFGEELAQSFADPATAPTLLLNLSNIAWFGNTVAIDQHLHISRMRSLELARPMLRATNTGATAIIDAQGVVTHRLPSGVQGALTAQVRGVDGPPTPYARWVSAWGLWPLAVWAACVLGAVAWRTRRFAP